MIDEQAIGERYAALRDQLSAKRAQRLDERGRRLYAAAEVHAIGYGGLAAVARATGLSRGTIGRGLKDPIRCWYGKMERERYPAASRLLITADLRRLRRRPRAAVEARTPDAGR
jgi:hypothetical protein